MKHWFNHSLLLAAVALMLPVSAFADAETFTTFDIIIENNPVVSDLSPEIMTPISKGQVGFHLMNNTGEALFFNDGTNSTYIPVVSNTTVVAPYEPGQEYKVTDMEGNMVAKWHVGDAKPITANVTPATAEQFAEWGSKLQQVIENQKVTYQEPPAKPEPRYYTQSSRRHHASDTIRGYW